MRLEVYHIVNGNAAVFHNEGLTVYSAFEEFLRHGDTVQLSFNGIQTCSTQFLNACIGKAYLTFSGEFLDQHLMVLEFEQMSLFKTKLETVIENARNLPKYDQIVGEAFA